MLTLKLTTMLQGEEELELARLKISTTGHLLNNLPYTSLTEICAVNMMGLRTCTLLVEVSNF